jgi:hypothetical protein
LNGFELVLLEKHKHNGTDIMSSTRRYRWTEEHIRLHNRTIHGRTICIFWYMWTLLLLRHFTTPWSPI